LAAVPASARPQRVLLDLKAIGEGHGDQVGDLAHVVLEESARGQRRRADP
jgi:hypothetical protein